MCAQADAEEFAALCLEPYSRIRILAGYSSAPGQNAEAEALPAGGIATVDLGTKKVVCKVCLGSACHPTDVLACALAQCHLVISRHDTEVPKGGSHRYSKKP